MSNRIAKALEKVVFLIRDQKKQPPPGTLSETPIANARERFLSAVTQSHPDCGEQVRQEFAYVYHCAQTEVHEDSESGISTKVISVDGDAMLLLYDPRLGAAIQLGADMLYVTDGPDVLAA